MCGMFSLILDLSLSLSLSNYLHKSIDIFSQVSPMRALCFVRTHLRLQRLIQESEKSCSSYAASSQENWIRINNVISEYASCSGKSNLDFNLEQGACTMCTLYIVQCTLYTSLFTKKLMNKFSCLKNLLELRVFAAALSLFFSLFRFRLRIHVLSKSDRWFASEPHHPEIAFDFQGIQSRDSNWNALMGFIPSGGSLIFEQHCFQIKEVKFAIK